MEFEAVWPILLLISVFIFNVLPCIAALASQQAEGLNKLIWFFAAFCLSWIGYFIFYFSVIRPEFRSKYGTGFKLRDENGFVIKKDRSR